MKALVKEIMSDNIVVLTTGSTLGDALSGHLKCRLDVIPVVDGEGRLSAVITKYNVYRALLSGCALEGSIAPHLITDIIYVLEDESFKALEEILVRFQVAHAVVVNREHRPVGIVAKVDLIRYLIGHSDFITNQLASLVNSITNGVIAVDQRGLVITVNPAAEKLLGIDGGKTIGQPLQKVLPEIQLEKVLIYGQSQPWQKQQIESRVVLAQFSPIYESDGKIKGALIVLQDMAEYEEIVQELESVKKLQHTLEIVLNLAYDGILVVDENGYVTMANRALADFLGVENANLINRHVSHSFPLSGLEQVLESGFSDIMDLQLINGRRCIISRQPIVHNGRVVGAIGKIMFRELERLRDVITHLGVLEKQVSYYKGELRRLTDSNLRLDDIITVSPIIQQIKLEAKRAAAGCATILMLGESGTGKDLFARAIHNESGREGPFIKVNCAAIPENLLESEFFGYDYGAFTGAKKGGKPGKFELANRGTLFLDEIGDMSPYLQAKLLRVLQEKELERVGGTKTIRVDVRIIAATNNNLQDLMLKGKFRKDLYYRLSVIQFTLPSLKDRMGDILPIVYFLIEKFNRIIGTRVKGLSGEVLDVLTGYSWPGNIRELENVIERALNLTSEDIIQPEHLPPYLREYFKPASKLKILSGIKYREKVSEMEKQAIIDALDQAEGNRTKAARLLKVSRSTFYEKLKKYNFNDKSLQADCKEN